MQKKFLFVFICTLASMFLSAQKRSIFNIPGSIPVPSWVNKIDWDHPNVFIIESIISQYKAREKKSPKRRDLNEEKKGSFKEENELDEEPYEVALRRWLNQIRPFIQRDGTIIVDKNYYKQRLNEAIQKQGLPRKSFNAKSGRAASTNAAAWSNIGPKRTYADKDRGIQNWQVNMYELDIALSNPNILYAGSETGILFKSVDKGLNWISINEGLPAVGPVTAIAVSPFNDNEVFAFIDNSELIYSDNGGNSWIALNDFAGGNTNKIIINPINSRVITASRNGIYYSDDTIHFTKSNTSIDPGSEIYDVAFNPSDPSIVYAVTKSPDTLHSPIMFYRSTDGGNNFTESIPIANTDSIMGARLAVSPANADYVYCISLHNDFPRLITSTNSGQDWNLTTTFTGTGLFGTNSTNGMSNGQGYYDLAIMVSPNNINDLIVGTVSCWKSTDAGLNFNPIGGYAGIFPLHPDAQSMVAFGNDAYIATDGGINYSTDFFSEISNYSTRHNGLTGSDYWGFGQGWSEDIVVGGRYHNGDAAIYENYGEGNSLTIGGAEDATGHVFQEPGLTRLTGFRDIGTQILPVTLAGAIINEPFSNTKWPSEDNYGFFSSKLMIDPRYGNVFYVGRDSGFWKSENQGASYEELKNFGSKVWRFDIARSNPNVIYLCTTAGINKTVDGGINWSPLSLPAGVIYSFYNTDITVNPSNENEIWFCMADGDPGNKVFKSTDGGANWVNYTGTTLNDIGVSHVLAQGGTNGGVYAITNRGAAKVFYRDASMGDWLDFSTGLPENFNARQGGIIFYRDNKLRLAGNRGIWESPLYSSGTPVAQPMANKRYINCNEDTIIFGDYSMLEYTGASWQWNFPGASYVSSTTEREPKVAYPSVGLYSATLTVTDAQARSSSKTVADIIQFTANNCNADTVAGKSISLNGENTPMNLGTANINSNNFSISCWIKPAGNQKSFSQLIAHDIYPGSAFGFGLGFSFSGYTPNLHLCYTDDIVNYQNYSNLVADSTKWNNVVLTYSPAEVTIYLNGVAEIVNAGPGMPVIDLSQSPFYINKDILGQNGNYKGEIDEIKIYDYALSQNEVREKMHLIQSNGLAEQGLIKYVQFNKIDNEIAYELVNKKSIKIPASLSVNSTAPVATGSSYRVPLVYSSGPFTFPGTGITLSWLPDGIYPEGELVGFRLNAAPANPANSFATFPNKNYFIINNYGANNEFTALQKIQFSNLSNTSNLFETSAFSLYKRPSTADKDSNWINLGSASSYSPASGNIASALEFSNNNISSFGQFYISNSTPSYNNNPNQNPAVGIGTNTPLGSALLDVTSTSKGFLPPRLSSMQRNAIHNPATGLMIWCTDCNELQVYNGVIWKSFSGAAAVGSSLPNVRICNQVWMLKNLDVSNYRNGDPIPNVTDAATWANLTTGAWCWYNNDSATYAVTYGKLYNWYAVNDPRGLAPDGWHIPTFPEWNTLKDCIGGGATAGGKMKSITGWIAPNFNATNSCGFTALPGGFCYIDGSFGENGIGSYWWSSTDAGPENATGVDISNTTEFLNDFDYLKRDGFSIRCVKD